MIFSIIAPLIIITLLGYLVAKAQWLNKLQLDGISKLTFYGFIPVYLFYHMANADLQSQLNPNVFGAFYLPVLVCYLLAFIINYRCHQTLGKSTPAAAVFALNSSYSNNIIVGLPVLLMAIGEQALPVIFIIVTFHSAMLFGITGSLAATGTGFNWHKFLSQNLKNPLIIGILSGLAFNVSGLALPRFIADSLLLIGKPAITLALFVLGASIAFYRINQDKRYIALACAIKLVLLPCLVFLFSTTLFALPELTTQVLVLLSACPIGVNAYLIAKNYQQHQETVASSVVVSTILSAVTIPIWLTIIGI